MIMKLYFAPMEGITSHIFRNVHHRLFGGCDKYFAPFIVPTENERITLKTLKDLLPENNNAKVVPQVLCNDGEVFKEFIKKLKYLGFDEVNLNFGCPSGTVVKKNRGAGILREPETLDRFLDEIFSDCDIKISVKTRVGFNSHDEFDKLLEIYNKYPISELIIHPRVREEYYKGTANPETFDKAYYNTKLELCYNGDIRSVKDFDKISEKYDRLSSAMIGRGAVTNPAIFREIKGGKKLQTKELVAFSKALEEEYLKLLGSYTYTFHRLKEIWMLMILNFPEEQKIFKAIKKSGRMSDLNETIACLPEL